MSELDEHRLAIDAVRRLTRRRRRWPYVVITVVAMTALGVWFYTGSTTDSVASARNPMPQTAAPVAVAIPQRPFTVINESAPPLAPAESEPKQQDE